jgi:GMP synthase-like glutamine amidotransferase
MRVHFFQHVVFEDPAFLLDWSRRKKHSISYTHFYANSWQSPQIAEIDLLIVLGGPMGVYDEGVYPWIKDEKKLIEQAISQGKTVIAICLGAQLVADVLGVNVFRSPYKEIGWHPLEMTAHKEEKSRYFEQYPDIFTAFHWHSDTFDIPPGAQHLMRSKGCENQAFIFQDRVFAFQFHLESTPESVAKLIANCRTDIRRGSFVQSEEEISHTREHFPKMHRLLETFLTSIAGSQ